MKRAVAVLGVVGVSGFSAWLLIRTAPAELGAPRTDAFVQTPPPAPTRPSPTAAPPFEAAHESPLASSLAQDYLRWNAFTAKLRSAARQPSLDIQTYRGLLAELARYEQSGRVSANEAALLRLALAKTQGPAAYRAEAEAMQQGIKAASAQQQAERLTHPDARFLAYKRQESAIVRQVMAMHAYPDGLDRDRYLRQRLQAAREAAYEDRSQP